MIRHHPVLQLPSVQRGSTDFLWATGIEDTFICQPDSRSGRILDEYALTQHYDLWREDLALAASLGVSAIRYGIPWYRVEPRPGEFDWDWTDRVLEELVNRHRIEPIVDLMHYGTPAWLQHSFLDPDYPARVAEYARAFALRYRGFCRWYTPLNEPRVNAWFAARLGWWPPYRRTWTDFVVMLTALARGIVLTQQAVSAVDSDAVFVHVDATDLYQAADSTDAALVRETIIRQALVFYALDLVQGRVDEKHALYLWLEKHKISHELLNWFRENVVRPDIIGYNMYPMFSRKIVRRNGRGALEVRNRPCGAEVFSELTLMYAQRYDLPVMCTETAGTGSPDRRIRWIAASVQQVQRLRASGVPVIGYTYWPLFSLIAWPYRQGRLPLERYIVDMGLWDLRADEATGILQRIPTPAVDAYRQCVGMSVEPLGSR